MRKFYTNKTVLQHGILLVLVSFMQSCVKDDDGVQKIDGELAGGATTIYMQSSKAFSTPAPNLSAESLEKHLDGDVAFEAIFVSGHAPVNGGLGPVFNHNSCVGCHVSDGRAAPPTNINDMSGFFFKISVEGEDEHGGPAPVPGFGTQLQHQSIYGYQKEAALAVDYEYIEETLADGTVVNLRKPVYSIEDPYMSMPSGVMISPRIAMPVFGLGLLEAIPESEILALADENDSDDDGISGKPNYVWDLANKRIALGRFGWKAGAPSVLVQSAGAYNEDMGITNPIRPVESSYGQTNGETELSDSTEIDMKILEDVTFYSLTLAVPAGRNFDDPQVVKGRKVFDKIGCIDCHTASFTTGTLEGIPEVSNQIIYPYNDMLLHDMGDGLADNRPEFKADGKEWKTRPLWGLGLTNVTSGHTTLLHDGRARSITEAILWHDGEAKDTKDEFKELSASDREALLEFLNAL
ncbi:di-heme oxidoredictase family protein [uncultured Draconibacterium sp.]|uniref:di-heme oxidoreductase family protein n=1 Tax=uncultured Draconibacterium sp. TaxID=1573823 RepID=UPI002AA8B887|nr:di-heme oxidoredictase family protein [uncultured Draconibacterium sp.]